MQYDISRDKTKGSYLDKHWIKVDEVATRDLEGFYDLIKGGNLTVEKLNSLINSLEGKSIASVFNKANKNPICWKKKMEDMDDFIDFVYDMEHYIYMKLKTNTSEFVNENFRKEIDDPSYNIHYGTLLLYRDIITESRLMSLRNITTEKVPIASKKDGKIDDEKYSLVYSPNKYYFNESKVNGVSTKYEIEKFNITEKGSLLKEIDKLLNSDRDLRRNLLSNRTMVSIKYLQIKGVNVTFEDFKEEQKPYLLNFTQDYIKVLTEKNILINIVDNDINGFLNEFMWEYFVSVMRNIDYGKVSVEDKILATFKKGDLVAYSGIVSEDSVDIMDNYKSLSCDGLGLAVVKEINLPNQSLTLEMFSSMSKDGSKTSIKDQEVKFANIFPVEQYNKNKMSLIDKNDKTKTFLERSTYMNLEVVIPADMISDLVFPRTSIFLNSEEILEVKPLVKNFNLKRW